MKVRFLAGAVCATVALAIPATSAAAPPAGKPAPAVAKRHPAPSWKHAPRLHHPRSPRHRGDEVVVMLREQASLYTVLARHRLKARLVYRTINGFIARVTSRQRARLVADGDIVIVEPLVIDDPEPPIPLEVPPPGTPHLYEIPQFIPWGLERVGGLLSPTAQIDGVDQRVDADVAVLDTGVAPLSDLAVAGGVDCLSGKPGSDSRDSVGHGTEVAGIVAGLDNSFGVVGVAPGARIWAVRILGNDGNGQFPAMLCGLDWVAEHASTIDVANLSLGGLLEDMSDDGNCGLTVGDPYHLAVCRAVAKGVTFVVSAGNESQDATLFFPASYDEVITVSGLSDSDGKPGGLGAGTFCLDTPDDVFAFFSNFGPDIDIAAPAVCDETAYPGDYAFHDIGTSFAAPYVSGAAALWRAKHPDASPEEVKAAILANREQFAMPGDPDGINEGVLSVAGF